MTLFTAFILYFLVWWVVLFGVLPLGVRGQAENNDVVDGSEPGAPVRSRMKDKVILTSLITIIPWAILASIFHFEWLTLENFPFLDLNPETNRYK